MKKIIFRADDLGYSEAVNYGILKSIKDGCIKNVGFMTNMEASEHGIRLLKDSDVCLGQHINISAGKPICDPSKIPSLVTEEGMLKPSSMYRDAKEDIVVLDEVILEIEAQYFRFKELVGKEPAYFDGHALASGNFFKGLEYVAQKYHLKYSPFPDDIEKPVRIGKHEVYLHGGSSETKNPKDTLMEIIEHAHEDACDMIVYHPGYLDAYIVKNSTLTMNRIWEIEMLCDPAIQDYLKKEQIQSITYDDL